MAKVTSEFVKFMTTYVDALNLLRQSIIALSENVGTATSGGKTIPQRADELLTMEEAIVIIQNAVTAGGDPVVVYISETSAEGLAPGIITPVGGVIGTRKLTFEETVYGNTDSSWYAVTALYDGFNYETVLPRTYFTWYEYDVVSKLIAYEGGRYHEFPSNNTTPLTDVKVASVTTIPIGVSVYYPSVSVPNGFLVEDGRALSKTEYPDLYAAIGDSFGSTSTTFNIPNKSGYICRGGSGVGVTITTVTAAYDHSHTPSATVPAVRTDLSPHIDCRPTGGSGSAVLGHYTLNPSVDRTFTVTGPLPTIENTTVRTSTTENRPKNISVVSCIKATY